MIDTRIEYKKNNVMINKSKKSTISTIISIPFTYLKDIGVNEDDKEVTLVKLNNYIIIAKDLKDLKDDYIRIDSILDLKIKLNKVKFSKNASNNISTKLPIPYSFLRDLGVDEENREVYIIKYNNYIMITKDSGFLEPLDIENKIKFHNNCEEFLNSILNSSLIELKSIAIKQMNFLSDILDVFKKFDL